MILTGRRFPPPGINFTNILLVAFTYVNCACSFFVLTFKVCTLLAQDCWRKSCEYNVGEIDPWSNGKRGKNESKSREKNQQNQIMKSNSKLDLSWNLRTPKILAVCWLLKGLLYYYKFNIGPKMVAVIDRWMLFRCLFIILFICIISSPKMGHHKGRFCKQVIVVAQFSLSLHAIRACTSLLVFWPSTNILICPLCSSN